MRTVSNEHESAHGCRNCGECYPGEPSPVRKGPGSESDRIRELEDSHDLLRGTLLALSREFNRLPKSRHRAVILNLLDKALAEARAVRRPA